MGFIIDLDLSKCSACGACAIACMDQNDIDIESGEGPFRMAGVVENGEKNIYLSIACQHCDEPACIVACPCACLKKDPATNFTVFDTTDCIGCHSCAIACPFGAPSFGPDGKMRKCDGCQVLVRQGLEPACVATCPTGALSCRDERELKQALVRRSLKAIANQLGAVGK
ncbi:MAG: 4Fe-4S binding protein [Peptococcaceae bacterium]|nr:4Fe-4S binding protein [Peptococcaceae bacterium]